MLGLASRTAADWAPRALAGLPEVLLDHAHCEKKAASTAINLIFRYAEHPQLMRPLSELAREELAHFEEVLRILERRGIPFVRVHPSAYAARLMGGCRDAEPGRLLDTLLACGLIEARSCERMQLLAAALESAGEDDLARFYRGLLAAEARHHRTYVDLARATGFADAEIRERSASLSAHEAAVLAALPPQPRLHA